MNQIRVQIEDFDLNKTVLALRQQRQDIGAVVTFTGFVRDLNTAPLISMTLEHYPNMTEKALQTIAEEAEKRWNLQETYIIHRYGTLKPADQIVLVAVAATHRAEAFQACEFIMDYLKTSAPFWKKETTQQGSNWVNAKAVDAAAHLRWEKNKP